MCFELSRHVKLGEGCGIENGMLYLREGTPVGVNVHNSRCDLDCVSDDVQRRIPQGTLRREHCETYIVPCALLINSIRVVLDVHFHCVAGIYKKSLDMCLPMIHCRQQQGQSF